LNNEVIILNSQLDHVIKQVRMMTNGTDILDKMLKGQIKEKPNGIDFSHERLKQGHQYNSYAHALEYYHKAKKRKPVTNIKFVASTGVDGSIVKEQMLQHLVEPHSSKTEKAFPT